MRHTLDALSAHTPPDPATQVSNTHEEHVQDHTLVNVPIMSHMREKE